MHVQVTPESKNICMWGPRLAESVGKVKKYEYRVFY